MKKRNFKKSVLAVVLILSVLLSQVVLSVPATEVTAEASEVWDGTKSSVFAGGTGTENDPFLIDSAEQLAYIVTTNVNGKNGYSFKLIKDIRINDTTSPDWKTTARNWVWKDFRFVGKFDGNGHTIDGLYYNGDQWKRALFSYIGGNGTAIKNIKFTNASINTTYSGSGSAGILAAQLSDSADISYIYVDETCEIIAPYTQSVAAIAPYRANSASVTIDNCAVMANIVGGNPSDGRYAGAFIGTFWSGNRTITNCFTASNVPISGKEALTNPQNNYALVADTTESGTTILANADQMKGENAKTYMPGLDFDNIWQTVENGYPVLRENICDPSDEPAASSFAGGTGTKADPYLIENGGQLYKMVADYSNTPVGSKPATHTYFKITEDIDLNNKKWCWFGQGCGSNTYINAINYGFSGIVDGGGHTISNLSSAGDTNYAQIGLIPIGTQGAEVRNLTVKSAALTGKNVGGVIFSLIKATGGSSAPIVIENCSVEDSTVSMNDTAGGLVGYIYGQSLSITNCSVVNTTFAATGSGKSANAAAFFGFANAYDNVHNNTLTVSKSFCSDVKPIGPRNTDWTNASTFTNVYTSCESYDSSVSGITKLTAEQMTGINAKANMQGLSFNQTWRCGNTGEYPTLLSNDMKALLWDGTAANSFAGGSGTAADPYKISNSEELYLLANADTASTFGKYYELTNDIAISDVYTGWQNDNPYSWAKKTAYLDGFTYGNSFAGILDGAGYTVSGLYYSDVISDNGAYAYGLIPFVSANAVIKNINVEDVYAAVTGNAYIGAVAGVAHVTADDIQKPLNMVQFVGVNADDCGEIAILGGASRGVKFELCNADALIGTNSEKISVRNCNTEDLSYDDDVLIYNGLSADSTMLVNIIKNILGTLDNYITDINGDSVFNLLDLVSAKKFLVAADAELQNIAYQPHSVTVSLFDTATSTYGFTWNTNSKAVNPVLQICEGTVFSENTCTEYPAAVNEENTYVAADGADTDKLSTYFVYKVEAQLEADKTYVYRIVDKATGIGTGEITLKARNTNASKFTFAHVSDSQVASTDGQLGGDATAAPFNKTLKGITTSSPNLDFILHTGDFVEYSKYESYWRSMLDYNADYFSSIPTMAISGNHETTYRNGSYETLKHFGVSIPEQDTEKGYYYSFDYGNTRFIMLNTNRLTSNRLTDDQYNWLVSTLESRPSSIKWTIVSMHNPMYSVGKWGSNPEQNTIALALQQQLGNLFAESGVDLVLQGHDHTYSKTYPIGVDGAVDSSPLYQAVDSIQYCVNPNGVVYAMNGPAGTQTRSPYGNVDTDIYELAGKSNSSSWAEITVEDDKLTVKVMYDNNGTPTVWNSYGIIKN